MLITLDLQLLSMKEYNKIINQTISHIKKEN